MISMLFILANPFNLIAFYFALGGRAIWGVGEDYKLDFSLLSLFKVFGVPTIIFASMWFLLKYRSRLTYWKLYAASSLLSILIIIIGSQIFWSIIRN